MISKEESRVATRVCEKGIVTVEQRAGMEMGLGRGANSEDCEGVMLLGVSWDGRAV